MSKRKPKPKEVIIEGNKLSCPVCGHNMFYERQTLMNTVGLTIMNLDFANKNADNQICMQCGYVYWFLPPR